MLRSLGLGWQHNFSGNVWLTHVLNCTGTVCTVEFFVILFFLVTGELSILRQMMKVPNEPGLSPNNGLENAFLSDQCMASNPREGQANQCCAAVPQYAVPAVRSTLRRSTRQEDTVLRVLRLNIIRHYK
jgi:hypothetical protein